MGNVSPNDITYNAQFNTQNIDVSVSLTRDSLINSTNTDNPTYRACYQRVLTRNNFHNKSSRTGNSVFISGDKFESSSTLSWCLSVYCEGAYLIKKVRVERLSWR